MVEHTPDKGAVAGSSPASPTIAILESKLTNLIDNVCETSNIKFDNFFGLYKIYYIEVEIFGPSDRFLLSCTVRSSVYKSI